MKKWGAVIAICLLLPANIWLAYFYFSTTRLIRRRMAFLPDTGDVYQSLNPAFALFGEKKDPLNDFWCLQEKNAVYLSVKDGKILMVGGVAEKEEFSWSCAARWIRFSWNQTQGFDFNKDLLADYICNEAGGFIQIDGKWLPVRKVEWRGKTARLNDGRSFQWKQDSWQETAAVPAARKGDGTER